MDKQYYCEGKLIDKLSKKELIKALKEATDRILTDLPIVKYDNVTLDSIPTPLTILTP